MYLIYTAQEEKLRKAWTNVLSHSFDKYMKQSGLYLSPSLSLSSYPDALGFSTDRHVCL